MNLNYEEFKEKLVLAIEKDLPDDFEIRTGNVTKLNGLRLESISVAKKGSEVYPTHYFQELYSIYRSGKCMEEILRLLSDFFGQGAEGAPIEFTKLEDFEYVKDKLMCKLVNYERNTEILESAPFIRFMDLAIVFYISIDKEEENYQALVNNTLLNVWKKDTDDLQQLAWENNRRYNPPVVLGVKDILMENSDIIDVGDIPEGGEEMLSIGCRQGKNGAIYMLDMKILGEIAGCVNDDLFIIPSSIHEIITVPAYAVERAELDRIIQNVNETSLSQKEYLSDHAYLYSRKEGRII